MTLGSYSKIGLVTLSIVTVLVSSNIIFPGSSQASTVSKTLPDNFLGLIGWWTFDGPDMLSVVRDKSGQGNNGNLVLGATGNTSTTTVPGKIGQAMVLDGTNDYVDGTNFADDLDSLTVSAWFKSTTTPAVWQAPIVVKLATGFAFAAGWNMGITGNNLNGLPNGSLYTWVQDDGGQNYKGRYYSGANDGAWHNATMVITDGGNTMTLYFDGSTSGTSSASGGSTLSSYSNSSNVRVGTDYNSDFFKGHVDDVRIYSRALSAAEVLRLYSMGR